MAAAAVGAAAAGALTAVVVAVAAAPRSSPPVDELAILAAVLSYAVVAVVVDRAQPVVGRLMLLGAVSWGVGEGMLALGVHGLVHDAGSVPAAALLGVIGTASRGFGWLLLILAVPMFFPDGRLPWPGWKGPGFLVGGAIGAFTAATLLAPRPLEYRLETMDSPTGLPLDLAWLADGIALGALVLCVVSLVVAVAGLVHRWRAGSELRRQQLLWLCAAFAVPVLFLPLIATDLAQPWMFALVIVPVPIAIAVAMLQRRLYDVQLAVSRTATWLALSAVVASLYAVTVGGVGALLSQRGADWVPWVGAGVVAVSFAPLHRVLQQAVNRITYGQWSQPAEVLASTGRRLVDASDVPALLHQLAAELRSGLGLQRVTIRDTEGRLLAAHGEEGAGAPQELPLAAYGVPVGMLAWRGPRLRAGDERLLQDLARQLGGVVHSAGLLASVREAGQRLALAREEERRRLRRDLHDGVGPQLAGLTLMVDTLRNRLGSQDVAPGQETDTELIALRREIQTTVVEVRRIVEGLRPPALDELGLVGAVEQLAQRLPTPGLEVRLHAAPLPPIPAAVEVAAYRIVQEAVANASRHSGARLVTISLERAEEAMTVEVSDDGRGGTQHREGGVGLASMRERAEQLAGRLVVESAAGEGTSVRAWLPTGSRCVTTEGAQ